MKKLGPKKASIAYSFGQLIQYDKNQYSKESDLEKKQEIVSRFICDPEVSYDFLDKYIKKCLSEKADTNDIYNSIDSYYGVLKYSLSKEKNNIIYKSIRILDPNQVDTCHKYLAFNDPIENFKNVSAKYLKFTVFKPVQSLNISSICSNENAFLFLKVSLSGLYCEKKAEKRFLLFE